MKQEFDSIEVGGSGGSLPVKAVRAVKRNPKKSVVLVVIAAVVLVILLA